MHPVIPQPEDQHVDQKRIPNSPQQLPVKLRYNMNYEVCKNIKLIYNMNYDVCKNIKYSLKNYGKYD